MAANRYRVSLLTLPQCPLQQTPEQLITLLKIWRKSHDFQEKCAQCEQACKSEPYVVCCDTFYYNKRLTHYPVRSIAIPTPGYVFLLPQLEKMIRKMCLDSNQEFLVLPDPIYWQVASTLIYEKVAKFVQGMPVTRRSTLVHPPSRATLFYKQIQEAPLNYGSLNARSCGKATLLRQVAYGKRCEFSMRAMIVPDASLRPNEIRLPDRITQKFKLKGQWVILNRMPTLQPENFVALRVMEDWPHDCFGIPLEIVHAINGDFDGDECNVYLVANRQSQAECSEILNSEREMGSFVMGIKLAPSQDMLVAYYLFYDDIDFLPYKHRDLKRTFQVIFETYGSSAAFKAFDSMRLFYLEALQRRICFALTLEEMLRLVEDFSERPGCLTIQVASGAKGSREHLRQMFVSVGMVTSSGKIRNSFWTGLTPCEAIAHAETSLYALSQSGKIWLPGYGYTKIAYNLHDLNIDYWGRLVDGKNRVIEKDAVDALHYTDIMSKDTFNFLISEVLIKKNKI